MNKKPPRETWEVILPDSIRTTSTGGKSPLGYCSRLPLRGRLKCLSCPVCLLNHMLCLYIACLYVLCTYPFPYSALYTISASYSPYLQHNPILFLYLLVWSTTLPHDAFISSPVWPFLIKNSGTTVINARCLLLGPQPRSFVKQRRTKCRVRQVQAVE